MVVLGDFVDQRQAYSRLLRADAWLVLTDQSDQALLLFLRAPIEFINNASSRRRPTNWRISLEPMISRPNRLSTAVSPVILKMLIGSINPFSVWGPTIARKRNLRRADLRVTSETT